MDLGINDRVAFVAGATSGLGLAVARALAADGARVALCGRRLDLAEAEASRLPGAIGVALDISDATSVTEAVGRVRQELGPIDIVVVNGGGPRRSTARELDLAQCRADAELLLYGPITLVQECLPDMLSRRWGRIVAIGSRSVQEPLIGLTTSSMFRVALASYLKLLATECAADGVTINMVLPGRIATDRLAQLEAETSGSSGESLETVRQRLAESIPAGRNGTPEELAGLAAFLCSDGARYITGDRFRVDGGATPGL